MIVARRAVVIPRIICLFACCLLFAVPSSAAVRWNPEAAAHAFEQARQKRSQITQADQPSLAQYLECAETYRKVYVSDPHYGRVSDAIYEEALMYQEAADRFSKPEYYRIAVKRFHLLVKDYGGNQECTDALKRLAAIYTVHLHDEQCRSGSIQALEDAIWILKRCHSTAAVQTCL